MANLKSGVLILENQRNEFEFPWPSMEHVKMEHPQALIHCEDYSFQIEGPVSVVNSEAPRTGARGILAKASEGWGTIWMVLPNYLSGMNSL